MSALPQTLPSSHPGPRLAPVPPVQRPLDRRWWLIGLAVILALAAILLLRPSPKAAEAAPTARIGTAAMGPLTRTLRIGGSVQATEFINVVAPNQRAPESTNQMILLKMVPSGTLVHKGDLIASIDAQAMQDHVDDLRETIQQAEADVNTRKAEQLVDWENYQQTLRLAQSDLDKARQDARAEEIKTGAERELLQLNVQQTEARYKQLQADVKNRQLSNAAELRVLELTAERHRRHMQRHFLDLATYNVHAPTDGLVITQSTWSSGERRQIRQGDQIYAGTLFMKVVNPSKMQLEATINQAESTLLRLNQPVTVQLDAFPEMKLPAHVFRVGALADGMGGGNYIRRIPIVIRIDQADSRVIPDMSAFGDVVIEKKDNVLQVPRGAVKRDASGTFVTLQNGRKQAVTIGMETATETEVVSGLAAGDKVLLD